MRKQQKQTLKFFVENAKNWLSEDVFNNKKIQSSQQQRNMFVYNYIKKNRPNNFLDIGCGTGNLVNKVFFYVKKNLSGIDFSKSMIDLANKKKINERIQYKCVDILKFKSNIKYDVISANGFIEYFSKKELILIFSKIKKLLTKNGKIFFSVRNRLFNVFSLNEFTKLEMNSNKIHNLLRESFAIVNSSFSEFKRNKSLKFDIIRYKQPNTGVNVSLINQYTPLQIIKFIEKLGFEAIEIAPINYHSVIPQYKDTNKIVDIFNSNIIRKDSLNKKLIPFSSSFIIVAKIK